MNGSRSLFWIKFALFFWVGAGCAEPELETGSVAGTPETRAAAAMLAGTWVIDGALSGTCPVGVFANPLQGLTEWTAHEHEIEITAESNRTEPLCFI